MPSAMKAHGMTGRKGQREGLSRGAQIDERKRKTGSQSVPRLLGKAAESPSVSLSSVSLQGALERCLRTAD